MTNKRNKKKPTSKAPQAKAVQQKAPKAKTPFGDVFSKIGSGIGSQIGFGKVGGNLGRLLGTGIGSIFGSGDYSMIGPKPTYNVLSGQVPKFSTTHATNIVCHREYLGDLQGSTAFNNIAYPLNPGISTTFPWLSQIALNYQQYRFHGLIFEFRPLITDFVTSGAPGVMVMTTNYNADQMPFNTRQEAENAEFAVAVKPTQGLVHMIECSSAETAMKLYNVRTNVTGPNQDLRLYDYGLTQIITQSNPNQVLGELWVSYCVEFFKPTLAQEFNVTPAYDFHTFRSATSSANVLGTIQVTTSGQLSVAVTANSLQVKNATVGINYKIDLFIGATGTTTTSFSIPTLIGCVYIPLYVGGITSQVQTTGLSANSSAQSLVVSATSTVFSVTWPPGSVIPSGANSEIYISAIDPMITA